MLLNLAFLITNHPDRTSCHKVLVQNDELLLGPGAKLCLHHGVYPFFYFLCFRLNFVCSLTLV